MLVIRILVLCPVLALQSVLTCWQACRGLDIHQYDRFSVAGMSDRSPLPRQGSRRGLLGLSLLVMLGGVISLGGRSGPIPWTGCK